jgi:hypothetical protein
MNSDIIHLRKAYVREWDGWLHVNSQVQHKGNAAAIQSFKSDHYQNNSGSLY